jgi:1-aminocyclopropane-1-carboxylate deaminase/D-cysteine desulfhydrase-like pyridoxal-dependent ACC family enzyme
LSSGWPALFRWFPVLEEHIPYIALGSWPTPIERILIDLAGRPREILVKREDLSARPYGGNKVRKLEFLLAEARRRSARRLITAGAAGSHHALATTLYGRKLGFEVSLVLFPQPLTAHVREIVLADHALGAELRFTRMMEGVPLAVARARFAHRRGQPFVIAPGGSDAVGTIGYVSAALEMVEQFDSGSVPTPSAVHVAAGTLGTSAGLALGFALAGRRIPVIATRITGRIVANENAIRRLIRGARARLAHGGIRVPDATAADSLIQLRHGQIGTGYGRETESGRAAAELFAAHGLHLDATYTAKAAAELCAAAGDAQHPPLFMMTLGQLESVGDLHADIRTLPEEFRRYLDAADLAAPHTAQ